MANVESQINVRLLVVEDQKLLLQSLQRGLIAEVFCVGAGWPCLVRKLSEERHCFGVLGEAVFFAGWLSPSVP